mgnify:CR=1 FL=1|jgi:hypothetical protein|tara:strand:+ start:2588 stop:3103 length:516 start_codon:yes stop_codon:yes gene_type:complete
MIKVYSRAHEVVDRYKDSKWLEVFTENEDTTKHYYYEFFSDDVPIGLWRLRHKNTITNFGNSFVYENQRKKGWGNKIFLVTLNIIKKVFPKTTIIYGQVFMNNSRRIHILDKHFGIENKYFETEEPNRFGFKESSSEVDDTFKEVLYYDTIDNLWNRNKKDIDKLKVVYEG